MPIQHDPAMTTCAELTADFPTALADLATRYGATVGWVEDDAPIPGSFWGDSEAGLDGLTVWVRGDTPVHSFLHEFCHLICMSPDRRAKLFKNAGGDAIEENAVCYLQILLADHLSGYSRERILREMDDWGYSFRLGSAAVWFREDAEDAREFLQRYGLVDGCNQLTFRMNVL